MAQITAGIVQPPAVASTEAQAKASASAGMLPVTSHTSPHRSEAHGTQSHLEGDVLKTMEPVTGLEVTISVPPRGVQQAVPLAPLLRATDRPRWRVHAEARFRYGRTDRAQAVLALTFWNSPGRVRLLGTAKGAYMFKLPGQP